MKNNNQSSRLTISIRTTLAVLATFAALAVTGTPVLAQDETTGSDTYDWNLGFSAGYLSGMESQPGGSSNPSDYWAQQRYYEAMNYRNGLRLNSFSLFGESTGKKEAFMDQLMLNVDGIGDPYTTASFRMRSFNSFDIKVDYKNMKYFMNRDDSIYTGLHKWNYTREFLNTSIAYDVSDQVKLTMLYNWTGHSGDYTMTVSPLIDEAEAVGGDSKKTGNDTADGSFGSYARGNFYWMSSPKNDQSNEYLLQGTFKVATNTAFTIGGGFRRFTQDINYTPVNDTSLTYLRALFAPNSFSGIYANPFAKVATTSTNNPLLAYSWDDNRKSNTPIVYFEAVSRPSDKMSVTANLRYENTTTDGSTIKGNMLGYMPTAGAGLIGPSSSGRRLITDTTIASNNNSFKSLIGSLTLSGHVTDELTLTGLYRYTNTDLTSIGTLNAGVGTTDSASNTIFRSLYNADFKTEINSTVTQHFVEGFINYAPINTLNLRAGLQYTARNPDYNRLDDDSSNLLINANLSRQQKGITPFVNFWFRPIHELKISGSYSHSDIKSYIHGTTTQVDNTIRIDPEKTDKYSLGFDANPVKDLRIGFQFKGVFGMTDLLSMIPIVETFDPRLTNKMASFSGSIGYSITKKTSIVASGEYRTNYFSIPVSYTRGQGDDPAPPYGDTLTIDDAQRTIDRSLDATLLVNEIEKLHILVGFSMIRSTGGSIVTIDVTPGPGQGPDLVRVGGPYTWNLFHAQASYDLSKNLSIMADYQLAMQKEDGDYPYTNVMNNYKASLIRGSLYFRL
ncbi:MAG: hypothetical protein Q8919_11275 [Bacteroidota bacterium]|nr:hypothetical protein [Bacteroidota bacterium]